MEGILDEAERLFARHGLDGVSLRQIGQAAGSSNNFAVQYHYGDKLQLVRAIFERRIPALELRRAELLSKARRDRGIGDVTTLFEVLFRPLAELKDASGEHVYGAFLLGLHNDDYQHLRDELVAGVAPVGEHITVLLSALNPQLPPELARFRVSQLFYMFLGMLRDCDQLRRKGAPAYADAFVLAEGVAQASAAFMAPPSAEPQG